MEFVITLLVTFFAGMGAGLGTGFAGMSAAAVISPMLITFLGMDPYMAVGIALSSDVLASAVSAYTYGKSKNLDIRNGLIMMASVLAFTVVGSYAASLVPSTTMGGFSVFMTFLLGVKFIVRPVMTTKEAMAGVSAKKRAVQSILCGVLIGFICGFIGAGGGMMMLLILTSVLGYELKTAVGTSVFIMTFTALTGAVSHFAIGGAPDWTVFALCVLFTLVWARIAAVFANKASPKTLTARPAWCSSSLVWSSCSSTFRHKKKPPAGGSFRKAAFPAARRRTSAARPRRPRPRRSAHRRTAARTPRPTSSSESPAPARTTRARKGGRRQGISRSSEIS